MFQSVFGTNNTILPPDFCVDQLKLAERRAFISTFAECNLGKGIVRVLNDDLVQPARGFGKYPYRGSDMEIVTYIS